MSAVRLAWFSPMPPARSGVAACSRELVAALRDQHAIDVFVDDPLSPAPQTAASAHDSPGGTAVDPYDLTVYQVGNSSSHDYLWPYLFRFPGLAVLHDVRLHHARAAPCSAAAGAPTTAPRSPPIIRRSIRASPRWRSPVSTTPLYYHWPMTRLIARRLTADRRAHRAPLRQRCAPRSPRRRPQRRLGHGEALDDEARRARPSRARARWSIPADTLVFGCFGGLTAEKRVPQILEGVRRHAGLRAESAAAPGRRLARPARASRADVHRLGLDGPRHHHRLPGLRAGAHRVHRRVRCRR